MFVHVVNSDERCWFCDCDYHFAKYFIFIRLNHLQVRVLSHWFKSFSSFSQACPKSQIRVKSCSSSPQTSQWRPGYEACSQELNMFHKKPMHFPILDANPHTDQDRYAEKSQCLDR